MEHSQILEDLSNLETGRRRFIIAILLTLSLPIAISGSLTKLAADLGILCDWSPTSLELDTKPTTADRFTTTQM